MKIERIRFKYRFRAGSLCVMVDPDNRLITFFYYEIPRLYEVHVQQLSFNYLALLVSKLNIRLSFGLSLPVR